jgi:hypothetical protein
MDSELRRTLDEHALRRLAELYARACDRLEPDLLVSLFAPDGVIEADFVFSEGALITLVKATPGIRIVGHEQLRAITPMLGQRFRSTLHCVMNQTTTIVGDRAEGETYCRAHHVYEVEGRPMSFEMAIRYEDRFVRGAESWRFALRRLVVDWTRNLPVDLAGQQIADGGRR